MIYMPLIWICHSGDSPYRPRLGIAERLAPCSQLNVFEALSYQARSRSALVRIGKLVWYLTLMSDSPALAIFFSVGSQGISMMASRVWNLSLIYDSNSRTSCSPRKNNIRSSRVIAKSEYYQFLSDPCVCSLDHRWA